MLSACRFQRSSPKRRDIADNPYWRRYGLLGHLLVEEVAHGVDEDSAPFTPTERQRELIGMERQLEAVPVARVAQRLETGGETLSVAVLAAGA